MKKPYPKYESHCCGAPVEVRPGKRKYFCEECGGGCIPIQKKLTNPGE